MERHDDDLTTAEPDNLPASADTVEPEWREQADAGAESEAARLSRAPLRAAGEREPDADRERSPLLPQGDAAEFQSRWEALQTSFVDEPRRAVQEGDTWQSS